MKLRKSILSSIDHKIRLSNEANEDINELLMWYELQKEGLGKEFYKCFKRGLTIIRDFPISYPKIFDNIRRCIIKKFSISIFYRIDHRMSEIIIGAVFHDSRDPKIWKQRKN